MKPTNQQLNQRINQRTNQSTNSPINRPINPPPNQQTNQPTNQQMYRKTARQVSTPRPNSTTLPVGATASPCAEWYESADSSSCWPPPSDRGHRPHLTIKDTKINGKPWLDALTDGDETPKLVQRTRGTVGLVALFSPKNIHASDRSDRSRSRSSTYNLDPNHRPLLR